MKNGIILLILIISLSLYAEDEAPSSTRLIIPPIVIEFEERSEQIMELIVPDYDEIVLPDFEIYLSDPGEIPIDEIEFDLPLPDFVEYSYSEGSPFFSEGVLGIGAKNHLVGNISLFRLGKDLRFSLSFAHEGLDGFGQNAAGTGYFYRRETFEGDFKNGDESFMISGSGSFKENEDGLQQEVSSHTSIIHRLSNIELGVSGSGRLSWNGSLGLKVAEKTLTGDTPALYDELVFLGRGGVGWRKDWFSVNLLGDYVYDKYDYIDTGRNIVTSDLQLGVSLAAVDISAVAGLFWIPGAYPDYPFSISLAGALRDIMQYQSSGGYFISNYLNYETWSNYPFFEASDGVDEGWFWDGKLVVSPFKEIDFGVQWLYRNMTSYLSVDLNLDPFVPSTGLFGVDNKPGSYLDLSSFIKLGMPSGWSLSFGWDGQMLTDTDVLYPAPSTWSFGWDGQIFTNINAPRPVHSAWSEIRYTQDVYGIFLSGEYSLDPFIPVPDISMGIHYTISEGVVLSLEGDDLLGFFAEDQFSWEPYIETGGTVTLLTKISL